MRAVGLIFISVAIAAAQTVTTPGGTTNSIPVFSGSTVIKNSSITNVGGNVGIGTSAPTSVLDVNGTLQSSGQTILDNAFRFYTGMGDGNNNYQDFRAYSSGNLIINSKLGLYFNYDHGTNGVAFYNGSGGRVASISGTGEAMFSGPGMSSFAGNVGIGTTAPGSKLTVNGLIQTTSGIKFPDNSVQTSATVAGPAGPQGSAGPRGPAGALTLPFSGTTSSSGAALSVTNTNAGGGIYGAGGNDSPSLDAGYGVQGVGGTNNTHDSAGGTGGIFRGGGGNYVGGDGVQAFSGPGYGSLAGDFEGDVMVDGTLAKVAGSFKIDHPLDPANKYLSHSFVESPDMMNIYNGIGVVDNTGSVAVQLPDWFEALNQTFRYQLTAIGAAQPNLHIAQKVSGNRFVIAGGIAGEEVSWQITGIRHDAYADAHRIPVEEEKSEQEKGHYLRPELFGHAMEDSVIVARHKELLPMMKAHAAPPQH